MNLHNIVAPVISAINPWTTVTVRSSTGYTIGADGTQIPAYTETTMQAQVQALQYNDLQQISALNIQGERRAMYLNGNWKGVIRADGKGGDVVIFPDGTTWLVVFVFEDWASLDGWVKVCVTLQDNS